MAAQPELSVPRPLVAFGVWVLIALVFAVILVVDPWQAQPTQALTNEEPPTTEGGELPEARR